MIKLLIAMRNYRLSYVLFCLLTLTNASHDTMSIEVSCEDNGIRVKMVSKRPFEGIVYSKGFYDDPICRYIPAHSDTYKMATFTIPSNRCGTQVVSGDNSIVNSIIVQQNPVLETALDSVHNVSCNNRVFDERVLSSSAIHVSGRSADDFHFSDEGIKIWMEIKPGSDLFSTIEVDSVHVGDQLTVVIYANDGGRNYGLRVKNCIAHDDKFINENTTLFQLADTSGCSVQPDLLSPFNVTRHTNGFSDIMAYSRMTAFRFTGKDFLHLSCAVQLCKSDCPMYCLSSHVGSYSYASAKKVQKRSIADEISPELTNSRLENRRLMKATINALAERLMNAKKSSRTLQDDPSLNFDTRQFSDQEIGKDLDKASMLKEQPFQTTLSDTNFIDPDLSIMTLQNFTTEELTTINSEQLQYYDLTTELTTINDFQKEDLAELTTINIHQDLTEVDTIRDLQAQDLTEQTNIRDIQPQDLTELTTITDLQPQNLTKELSTITDLQQQYQDLTEFAKNSTGLSTKDLEAISDFDNIETGEKYMYNVTKVFFVNTRGDKNANAETENVNINSSNPYCFPKIKFSLVAGLLSFFLFCLILVVLCMSIYIKREKKKHRIDSFLLYNFQ